MLFAPEDDDAIFLSRTDKEEPLSSYSPYGFFLDDAQWPTVAHYFHAMKFEDAAYQQKIREAETPEQAAKLGRSRFKRIRRDWKKVRFTVMTRAVYIRCRSHEEIAELLLNTGDKRLVENSAYDYYWGCGRDRRGENHYGKVLMNVREKLMRENEKV